MSLSPVEPVQPRRRADWVSPAAESQGLPRYLEMVRAGRWLALGVFFACLGAAGLYLARAQPIYEAEADLLVTPFPRDTPVVIPGVVRESSDPTRDVETVARLVESPPVARRVKDKLRLEGTTKTILTRISAAPVAQSNIVTVTARAGSPAVAQDLANAFGEAMVEERSQRLRDQVEPLIRQLRRVRAAGADTGRAADDLDAAIAFLEGLPREDPTVRLEVRAERPANPVSPRKKLTLVAAVMGGGILGLVAVFALHLLDPRLRREQQLRQRFRLPILTRVPLERRRRRSKPLLPQELSMAAHDSYQALRAALSSRRKDTVEGRVVLVSGPSPGDGKTTAAINLAATLASAGKRVILIEADSRRPSIGRALGLRAEHGLASVLSGSTYLVDALVDVGTEDSKLRLLLNAEHEATGADMLSHLSADTLMLQAKRLADWVIVDSPPLNHVAETMTIAGTADDVLIVVRVGNSNLRDLDQLAEMLSQQDIVPTGFVVFGGQARASYY